jgi:oxepin-CoA hydrolase/3-oxo-5,6-dehydrosuberyl-CoA semialdehyde dehydrogenase
MQRTALQGSPTMLSAITQSYTTPAAGKRRPSRICSSSTLKSLMVGHTVTTAKHTITEADIVNFANVSGDHFYAHVDETSLDGTIFEQRVAHGYYLLSKAAGLFVDPEEGPRTAQLRRRGSTIHEACVCRGHGWCEAHG